MKCKSNVVLFAFIKNQALQTILSHIQNYEPACLYVVIDLPRNENEMLLQQEVKKTIAGFENKLNVHYLIPKTHKGLGFIFDFALDAIFEMEDRIIILEDDTIPSINFFQFCNDQLDAHQTDKNITSIIGTNMQNSSDLNGYFSAQVGFPFWGWATWKEKWLAQPKTDDFYQFITSKNTKIDHIINTFVKTKGSNISWDLRWCVYQYLSNSKVVLPTQNMITNNGFNHLASFTKNENSLFKNLPLSTSENSNWQKLSTEKELEFELDYIDQVHLFITEFTNL